MKDGQIRVGIAKADAVSAPLTSDPPTAVTAASMSEAPGMFPLTALAPRKKIVAQIVIAARKAGSTVIRAEETANETVASALAANRGSPADGRGFQEKMEGPLEATAGIGGVGLVQAVQEGQRTSGRGRETLRTRECRMET